MTPDQVLDAHPDISVVSFDFFDTLVTRTVAQPTHVFAVMEENLVARGGERWHGFAVQRVIAERRARDEKFSIDEHSDIQLDDILCQLAILMKLRPAERSMLRELEESTEIELTEAVEWGADLFRIANGRGLRTVVVSDNYMSSAHLSRVATRAGLAIPESTIFVSCEQGRMKHDGSIWPVVLGKLGVNPGDVVHVGDLTDADGSLPRSRGIATFVNPSMRVCHREPLNTNPAVLPLSRLEAANRSSVDKQWNPARNLASGAMALVVAGQVLDIVRRARETSIQAVHFTARDGWLAHQVYQRVRQQEESLPRASYTGVSRSITWRASLEQVDESSVARFIGDDEVMTVNRLRMRFGCDFQTEIDPDSSISAEQARELVVANADAVKSACVSLRARLIEHLRGQGVIEDGHHILMDLGWSGSVVSDLASIVRTWTDSRATFEGRLTALYWDASSKRTSMSLHGLACDEFAPMEDNIRLLGVIRYMETLMTAPHGSVIDYRNGEAVHAKPEPLPDMDGVTWDEFASIVIDTATQIVTGTHPLVRPADVDGSVVWAAMMQVAHTPTDSEIQVLGSAAHDTALDHLGGGTRLVALPPEEFVRDQVFSQYDSLLRHHWAQGSLSAWWANPGTRWIADAVRHHMPALSPQWVRA